MQENRQKVSPIKQRILQFASNLNISKREFYKKIGVSRGTLESSTGITEEVLAKFIAAYPEVELSWLITGNGNITKGTNDKSSSETFIKGGIPIFDCDAGGLFQSILEGEILPCGFMTIPGVIADGAIQLPRLYSIVFKKPVYYLFSKFSLNKNKMIYGKEYIVSYTKNRNSDNSYPITVVARLESSDNKVLLYRPGLHISGEQPVAIDFEDIFAIALIKATVHVSIQDLPRWIIESQ